MTVFRLTLARYFSCQARMYRGLYASRSVTGSDPHHHTSQRPFWLEPLPALSSIFAGQLDDQLEQSELKERVQATRSSSRQHTCQGKTNRGSEAEVEPPCFLSVCHMNSSHPYARAIHTVRDARHWANFDAVASSIAMRMNAFYQSSGMQLQ